MKTCFFVVVALAATVSLRAQTNDLERTPVPAAPNFGTPQARPVPAVPATLAPTPQVPTNSNGTSIRNAISSRKVESINTSLDAQKPRPKSEEPHRVNGLFPSVARTVKAKGNLFQLINPLAPMSDEEKSGLVERSRVFDDPRNHANSGLDIFSVSFAVH
jgi:hypothetical protein